MATPSSVPSESAAGDLPAWLRLALTRGLGAQERLALLREFGPPDDLLGSGAAALSKVIGQHAAVALLGPDPERDTAVQAALDWQSDPDCRLLTLADPDYPQALLALTDPPLVLYVRGYSLTCLNAPALAVVGSRHATAGGRSNARAFSRALADAGLTIISGLAQGIDAAAHEGALSSPSGTTVAIMGTGIDRVYPAAHRDLAHRIVERGALVTELPLGAPPVRQNFPRRNRLIAAMAAGVLVVEAARQSGSLITARLAGDLGREVFAIPGSIHSPQSRGCHQLIRQGAKLVESATDVLEELPGFAVRPPSTATRAAAQSSPPAEALLSAMGWDPVSMDSLLEASSGSHPEIACQLLELELEGRVARLPDGRVQRVA